MLVGIRAVRPSPRVSFDGFAAIGMLAGAGWLALGVESIVRQEPENIRNAAILVPWLLTGVLLWGVRSLHLQSHSKLLRIGFWAAVAGILLAIPGQLGFLLDADGLKAFAAVSFGLWIGGMAAFGTGVVRERVAPRVLGVALALTQPGTMAMGIALSPWVPLESDGSFSGAIVHGCVFLAISTWLLRRGEPALQ